MQQTISSYTNIVNPFTLADKERLYNLESGAPVPQAMAIDVLHAETAGKTTKETFISDGYKNGSSEALFFEPIKKQKLKTM